MHLVKRNRRTTAQAPQVTTSAIVSAFTLAACANGEGEGNSTDALQSYVGSAIKGPLNNFRLFIDGNGNGVHDADEISSLSGDDGAFVLQGPAGQILHGEVTETTVDAASGRVVAGYFAAAPAGATVMTPMTTVLAQTTLTETELRQALGLSVDLLHYNPFDQGHINTAEARNAEHVAQQLAHLKVITDVCHYAVNRYQPRPLR